MHDPRSRRLLLLTAGALAALGLAVLLFDEQPHLESCLRWGYQDHEFTATNSCVRPVHVQFQRAGRRELRAVLAPGERWPSGVKRHQMPVGRPCYDYWMFSACPVGYVSSVPFWAENCQSILSSDYACVRAWRVALKARAFVNF